MPNSLTEAIREDVGRWPGTQASLSVDVFGADQTLRHKLVGYKGSVLGLEDVMSIMQLTGGRATIHEQARMLGGVYLQLPPMPEHVENADLQGECHRLFAALTDVLVEVTTALANDGKIDSKERRRIERKRHVACTMMANYLGINYLVYGTDEVASPLRAPVKARG